MTPTEFEQAIAVFVHGFAFTRSYTHPYLVESLADRVWTSRDAPRRRDDYRVEEVVASGTPIAELDALAREKTKGHFRVCYMLPTGESDKSIRADFKALGYRLMGTEEFMIHRLNDLAEIAAPYPIVRVTTQEQADLLAKAAGKRQILAQHLTADPPPMRQYMALKNTVPVGWVGGIIVGNYTWCSAMYVNPDFRRQGIARSLLYKMLTDDRDNGANANILLASHTGSKLYPTVGYETLGTLYMFTPPKKDKTVEE